MTDLLTFGLAIAFMVFGAYCLAFAVGAVTTHPVTWAGGKIGSAIRFAVRLPFRLLGGVARGAIKGGRRKRRPR